MKRTLAVLLSMLMLFGCLPVTGFSVSDGAADGNAAAFMRIVHLDCGRKYFSVEEIKGVIDMAAENLYTHVELAFGNDGLRFLPDDMSVSVNSTPYESDAVKAAIQTGNANCYDDPNGNALTESDMDAILTYAAEQGISIIPLLNSPGHMNALMTAGEALTKQTLSYSGSERTIDVTNTTATAFTLAVLEKYVRYFADKGCTHFNLGADEYANDISSSGFGAIQSAGLYDDYIAYVNSAAAIVKEAGMTPMAFNDGIYYNSQTSYGTFDSDIAVCFWTAGWPGYTVASASTLAQKGHEIINTNDAWYYVLGNANNSYTLSHAQTGTKGTACTTVPTDSSGSVTPIGCMLCIWCDSPSVSYTTAEQENISGLLTNLAENNAEHFTPLCASFTASDGNGPYAVFQVTETPVDYTFDTGISAAADMHGDRIVRATLTVDVTVGGIDYYGRPVLYIPYSIWDKCFPEMPVSQLTDAAFSGNVDGDAVTIAKNDMFGAIAVTVPHFSTVTLTATTLAENEFLLGIGEVWTQSGSLGDVENAGNAVAVTGGTTYYQYDKITDLSALASETTVLVVDHDGRIVNVDLANLTPIGKDGENAFSSVPGINVDTAQDSFTHSNKISGTATVTPPSIWESFYRINFAFDGGRRVDPTSPWSVKEGEADIITTSSSDVFQIRGSYGYIPTTYMYLTQTDHNGAPYYYGTDTSSGDTTKFRLYKESQVENPVRVIGQTPGEATVTVGGTAYRFIVTDTKNITLSLNDARANTHTETLDAAGLTPEIIGTDVVDAALSDGTLTITAKKAGTATVTLKDADGTVRMTYNVTVELDLSLVTSLVADLSCTTNRMNPPITLTIKAEDLLQGKSITDLIQDETLSVIHDDDGMDYHFWKACIIDRAKTKGGQVFNNGPDNDDNDCVSEYAVTIDALRYNAETDQYEARRLDNKEWFVIENPTPTQGNGSLTATGSQLIFYYMVRYAYSPSPESAVFSSDWGYSTATDTNNTRKITFQVYELPPDTVLSSEDFNDTAALEQKLNGSTLLTTDQTWLANGIRVIKAFCGPDQAVVCSVVDYDAAAMEDRYYQGQITDTPALEKKQACTVKIYLQDLSSFVLDYDCLIYPEDLANQLPESKTFNAATQVNLDSTWKKGQVHYYNGYKYTFSGWCTDAGFENPAASTFTVNKNTTLYGNWTREKTDALVFTSGSAETVYENGAALIQHTVSYNGAPLTLTPVTGSAGQYTASVNVDGYSVPLTFTFTGQQTDAGESDNTFTVEINSTEIHYTAQTIYGKLKVYPKIVVEYYKDTLDGDPVGSENYQSVGNNRNLYFGSKVSLSGEWLTYLQPTAYATGVQKTDGTIFENENEKVIKVLYLPAHTSLTIGKTLKDNVAPDENQTFLFRITDDNGLNIIVSIHGSDSVVIDGLAIGRTYTVTEITEWSWRYGSTTVTTTLPEGNWSAPAGGSGITVTLVSDAAQNTVTFQNERTVPYWLDGDNYKVNIFGTLPNTPQS